MLAALAAQAVVIGAVGAKRKHVPIEELITGTFTTSLAPNELIHSIEIPGREEETRAVYLKYTPRSVDDYATVSVGACAVVKEGRFRDLRIFLGAVGPRPMRAAGVEGALRGRRVEDARLAEVSALVRGDIDPIDDIRGSADYKREMARVFTERALRALVS
jgi:carbon-monoxide dehydrogenase medium subunit